MVPLKYLSFFWRTLEMPLINCEIELIVTWSKDCGIIYIDIANQVPTFTITETNFYFPVVTLSTQDIQPIKNDKIKYENIWKIAIGQGDDYTTGCLLDYTYFKKCYKMI